jgi:hypothetical protein
MDFKSLITKISSMDDQIPTVASPVLDKAVQLNEDAALRVLAGQSTYVAEAKKKKEEDVKEEMKVGDKKPSSTGGTIEKTATGVKHHAGKNYGGDKAPKDDDEDAPKAKKAKKESVEPEFKSKFMKMVEAKKEEAADKKKADAKKKKMDEAKKPDEDGDGVPDWADKKKGEDDNAGKKTSGKKGMSAAQEKYFGKKNESKMMPKGKKRPVKESVETKLSFKQMVQLVQESGGQQQIDPVDKALFTWAERVAKNKLGEGMKADLYAGLVYERNGGVFEMYDVLNESKKKIVESRSRLDEGMMDKVKNVLMSKLAPKLSDEEKDKMADVAKQVLGKDRADKSDFTLANIKAVAKALGAKPDAASESIEEGPIGDFFGQKKVDPKSGMGTIGGIDAYHPSATLGEKLSSLTGILGGTAATIAGLFGGPAWLIIPGVLGIMFLSQIGMSKDGSS